MTTTPSPAVPSSLSSGGTAQTGEGARASHGRPVLYEGKISLAGEFLSAFQVPFDTLHTETWVRTPSCPEGKSTQAMSTGARSSGPFVRTAYYTPSNHYCHATCGVGKSSVFIDTQSEPGAWARHLRHTAAMRHDDSPEADA